MKIPMPMSALILASLLAAPLAMAQDGNAEEGKKRVYTCGGCHGITGYVNVYPTYKVPKIGGQSYEYLVAALKAYRAGERAHPTMRAQAGTMSDEDIANIARYLSSLEPEE